ncbi:MAG: DUF2306 domain-containing protein [Stenotrophomonas sp.]
MKRFGTACVYFLSLAVAAYAVIAYALLPLGSLVHPDMKVSFLDHRAGIYLHVLAASVALALGPFQFSARLRKRFAGGHRWMGRLYLSVGVLLGGLSGLYMATFAFGGVTAKIGFACLAVLWLYTGLRAYRAIRRGAVAEHRKWMVRNFALTLAAVTLRIYLPSSMIAGIPFDVAYPVIAWLCWVPNLLVAELCFNGSNAAPLEPMLARDAA